MIDKALVTGLLALSLLAGLPARAAEVTEDFDGGWSDPSYAGTSTYNHAGVGIWESNDALVANDKARSGDYVRLRNSGSPYLEFQGLDGNGVDGGVGTVSFWYRHWDGDGSTIPFVLEYRIGGGAWVEAGSGTADSTTYQLFSESLGLAADDVTLRIRPTSTSERLLIDDFAIADAPAGPVVGFDSAGTEVLETAGTIQIPVTLTPAGTASVSVAVAGGDAGTPGDFQLLTTSLSFTAANPTRSVELAITNDAVAEAAETVELLLQSPVGAALATAGHTVTISDDDAPPGSGDQLVIVAANTTSGNLQQYEGPGDRIFQALDPDIVGIQEFNVPDAGGHRAWVDRVFGTEFHYMIEAGGESIPCGVISRYPITASGEWQDPQVNDRDFAWASIDIPGPKDLHVVSVHFHGSGGSSSRNIEAGVIVSEVSAAFPADDYIVLCGDLNTTSRTEAAVTTLKAVFSDAHVPVDRNGDDDTNQNRNNPYDWVMPNAALDAIHATYELGGRSYPDGLVFDTRLWSPPPSPALAGDSGAGMMQHMAVVKAFQLPATETSNGTPHSWLESHGIHSDFEAADAADLDGDGFPTWQEYLSNTDPTAADSRLEIIDVGWAGNQVAVTCSTQPGRRYVIEFVDHGTGGSPWNWAGFASAAGEFVEGSPTPGTHVFHDDFSAATTQSPPAGSSRLYRVRAEIP